MHLGDYCDKELQELRFRSLASAAREKRERAAGSNRRVHEVEGRVEGVEGGRRRVEAGQIPRDLTADANLHHERRRTVLTQLRPALALAITLFLGHEASRKNRSRARGDLLAVEGRRGALPPNPALLLHADLLVHSHGALDGVGNLSRARSGSHDVPQLLELRLHRRKALLELLLLLLELEVCVGSRGNVHLDRRHAVRSRNLGCGD
mmetsp:Transcript_16302/g.38819  ORF Transcript_16302/g.38819 Transcript_16302/m.38819 type:complete len:207 (-) Transcript_16302:382-1002(-)